MKKILLFLVINVLSFSGYYIDYHGILYDTILDNKVYNKLYMETNVKMSGGIKKGTHACVAHFEDMYVRPKDGVYILINFSCDMSKLRDPKQKVAYQQWKDVINKGYPILISPKDVVDETPKSYGIWYFDIAIK